MITVLIDGVDHTNDVELDGFNLRYTVRDAGRLSFLAVDRHDSTSGAYRAPLFASIVVTDGAATLFDGTITEVGDEPIAPPRKGTRVRCQATAATPLDRTLITQSFVGGPFPIANSTVGLPTSLTVVGHTFVTGQIVSVADHQEVVPDINGLFYAVTVTGPDNVTLPVNVTTSGGGGTIRRVVTLQEAMEALWALMPHSGAEEITWDAANPTGPVIEAPVWDAVTLRAAMASLAGVTGYVIRVTPANVLQYSPPGSYVLPYSLTATNRLNVGPVTWQASVGQYANTLILKYGAEVQTRLVDIFTGTGAINVWTLSYRPVVTTGGMIVSRGVVNENGSDLLLGLIDDVLTSDPTGDVITTRLPHQLETGASVIIQGHSGSTPDINGTHLVTVIDSHAFSIPVNITAGGTGGTYYESALIWTWYPPTNQLFRASPLPVQQVATLEYDVQFPQQVTVDDSTEVAARGVWQTQRTITTIFDKFAAVEWAEAVLRGLKNQALKVVQTDTRQAMPLAGDTITLTFPDKLVTGDHLIIELRGVADADGLMRYTIRAVDGTEFLADWMDLLRDLIGSGTGGAVMGGAGVVSGPYIPPSSGGVRPGGPDTAVQYNAAGTFGGKSTFRFDYTRNNLLMGGGGSSIDATDVESSAVIGHDCHIE